MLTVLYNLTDPNDAEGLITVKVVKVDRQFIDTSTAETDQFGCTWVGVDIVAATACGHCSTSALLTIDVNPNIKALNAMASEQARSQFDPLDVAVGQTLADLQLVTGAFGIYWPHN